MGRITAETIRRLNQESKENKHRIDEYPDTFKLEVSPIIKRMERYLEERRKV